MIKIRRLYSEPETFTPVNFYDGINLIVGEPNPSSNKTNGVGKTLLIEFINFCLLKDFKFSRVSKIPSSSYSSENTICLDVIINKVNCTLKRNIKKQNEPVIIYGKKRKEFDSIQDALEFLTSKLFHKQSSNEVPSFRSMMGPLIRDEGSEFKSIVDCYDTTLKLPPDLTPHLYLFGIKIDLYKKIKNLFLDIDKATKTKSKIKGDIELLSGVSLTKAKAELNEINSQLDIIKSEMTSLDNNISYEYIRDEASELDIRIGNLRNRKAVLNNELKKINLLNGDNYINDNEVVDIFNKFKSGLGTNINKELSEVIAFKKSIDNFQNKILNERKLVIFKELKEIETELKNATASYADKMKTLDVSGPLTNIKQLILVHQKKVEEQSMLSALLQKYDKEDNEIRVKKDEKSSCLLELDFEVKGKKETINNFEETMLAMHEYIFGNKKGYFEIKTIDKKLILDFVLRIDDDGSHSNEREKVFFYDISLLLTSETFSNHPGLLIHDNIFDVDQDTLMRSLNFLAEKSSCLLDCQYILTLNSDKLSKLEKKQLKLDIDKYKRVTLTKQNRFLGRVYQQK
ncbi:MAG: DUF2326 domain-containing protein [Pantoea sp.]|uniref:DUF2326 domain-containing protein n=1 Tax=Pantoea sp. TaxID=69393 RepID=UPI0039E70E01